MKTTIDDLRSEYRDLFKKEPAKRWNKTTLNKKITDEQILQSAYASKDRSESPSREPGPKPEFEKMAAAGGGHEEIIIPEETVTDNRGGLREGAGRPPGQTDERSRVERLLKLEVPDLAVRKVVQGLNLVLAKFSEIPFTSEQVDSISLGVTLPLYYWFPSVEGMMNPWTLHFQAMEYIGKPVSERIQAINQIHIKEQDNDNKRVNKQVNKEVVEQKPGGEKPGGGKTGGGKTGGGKSVRKKRKQSSKNRSVNKNK